MIAYNSLIVNENGCILYRFKENKIKIINIIFNEYSLFLWYNH